MLVLEAGDNLLRILPVHAPGDQASLLRLVRLQQEASAGNVRKKGPDILLSSQPRIVTGIAICDMPSGNTTAATIPLAEPGDALRVLLRGEEVRYFLARHGQVLAAQQDEE